MRFRDCVVVVTGVGREGQVGEAVADAFASEGASLVVLDRLAEEAEARAASLRLRGHRADARGCDLSDAAAVQAASQWVKKIHGERVDALVNLAGGFAMSGPVAETDVDAWHRQITINLTTAFLATRYFLPFVRTSRGTVVFFASEAALPGGRAAGMWAYVAAKSGVLALMRAVAQEELANGVRANAVAPTAIRTAANLQSMGERVRYVEREAVADAVLFLCSDAARAVTGQVITLS